MTRARAHTSTCTCTCRWRQSIFIGGTDSLTPGDALALLQVEEELLQKLASDSDCDFLCVDIHPEYSPSDIMLTGEPYVLNYLQKIDSLFVDFSLASNKKLHIVDVIQGHVRAWIITSKDLSNLTHHLQN